MGLRATRCASVVNVASVERRGSSGVAICWTELISEAPRSGPLSLAPVSANELKKRAFRVERRGSSGVAICAHTHSLTLSLSHACTFSLSHSLTLALSPSLILSLPDRVCQIYVYVCIYQVCQIYVYVCMGRERVLY